jgi:hypothetical protein
VGILKKEKNMEPTLNITPSTPEDFAAFQSEYEEWSKLVDSTIPLPEPESEVNERDLSDIVREHDELVDWQNPDDPADEELCLDCDYDAVSEDDCPLDGDAESALASAGLGMDEDYDHYGNDEW